MRRMPSWKSVLLLLLAWTGGVACGAETADGWLSDFDAALAEAQRLNRPLLVHFYADWCGPCRQMEQGVLHRPDVLAEIRKSVVAVKVNTDRSPHLATRYNVEALPMDLFLEPDGKQLLESTGYRSVSQYRMAIARAATRYADLVARRAPKPAPAERPADPPPSQLAARDERLPMLDGYCPVTLWKNRRWEKGSPQFRAEFRDQIYQMASAESLQEFNENPSRFAPRFLGCDAVIVYESDRAVLGSTRYAAFYDDQLFLFVDDHNRQAFKKNPDNYVKTRVVLHVDQIEVVAR